MVTPESGKINEIGCVEWLHCQNLMIHPICSFDFKPSYILRYLRVFDYFLIKDSFVEIFVSINDELYSRLFVFIFCK